MSIHRASARSVAQRVTLSAMALVAVVMVLVAGEVVVWDGSSALLARLPPSTELAEPAAVLGKVLPEELDAEPPRNLAEELSLSRRPPKKGFCTAIGSPCEKPANAIQFIATV